MTKLFINHTQEEHANSVADYLPNGLPFQAKKMSGTKMRQLLLGLAEQLRIAEEKTNLYTSEYDITTTTDLIEEWEAALGIPDECFSNTGTVAERRNQVLAKLTASVATGDDFVALGALFGITITVAPGGVFGVFPMTFPILFFGSVKEAKFTMVIDFTVQQASRFPLTFPFTFGSPEIALLECLFLKLKPANVQIIFRQV